MAALVAGHRQGPSVVFGDEDGLGYAVRLGAILSISEMAGSAAPPWSSSQVSAAPWSAAHSAKC